jgi:hypothetical protein
MFEAPVEPPTPPRPAPREVEHGDATWVLESVLVNPSGSTRVAWQAVELLRKLECTEVKNFWGPDCEKTLQTEVGQILPGPPRQQVVELREVSRDQSRAVMLPESMIIEQSRLFCCLDCVKKIESRAVMPNGVSRLHIDYCHCV